ncbi:hypothetical protein GCM10010191_62750 [Actinomadura vinacea]|uniref:DUF1963 domain-containing protein n=1 Tax=Actinomadura vinacea TaxID=115336 RepID=A0ABN3JSE0_9ACTN
MMVDRSETKQAFDGKAAFDEKRAGAGRPFGPEEQQEVLQEIVDGLRSALPPGWAKARFRWMALAGAGSQTSLTVFDQDGNSPAVNPPSQLGGPCGRLKHGMHRPGTGTWISMSLELTSDGAVDAEFNHDEEPEDTFGFVPEHFRKELVAYPRDPEHVPNWWQEILDAVPNFYMGVHAEPGERYRGEIGPDLGEVAMAFEKAGWTVGPGEFAREFRFSTDWTALETLTNFGLVRMAGRVEPADWDRLIGFFHEQGWNFGATLYDGDIVIKEVKARRQEREA